MQDDTTSKPKRPKSAGLNWSGAPNLSPGRLFGDNLCKQCRVFPPLPSREICVSCFHANNIDAQIKDEGGAR